MYYCYLHFIDEQMEAKWSRNLLKPQVMICYIYSSQEENGIMLLFNCNLVTKLIIIIIWCCLLWWC